MIAMRSGLEGADDAHPVALSSREVYRNRWMAVREDIVDWGNGATGIYGVVEKPDYSLIIPAENDGFYLVEQYRYPVGERFWEFPQGSVDTPEALGDPHLTARIELAEETGLRATTLTTIGFIREAYGFLNQGAHVIVASGLTRGEASPEITEVGMRTGWFSHEDTWGLIDDGRMSESASIAALALYDRKRARA